MDRNKTCVAGQPAGTGCTFISGCFHLIHLIPLPSPQGTPLHEANSISAQNPQIFIRHSFSDGRRVHLRNSRIRSIHHFPDPDASKKFRKRGLAKRAGTDYLSRLFCGRRVDGGRYKLVAPRRHAMTKLWQSEFE